MKAHKRGLGRGLEVLLADHPADILKPTLPSILKQPNSATKAQLRLLLEEASQLHTLLEEVADLLKKNPG